MLPELDFGALRRTFAPQFEAAENLQRYAWRHRPRSNSEPKPYRHVVYAIFGRSTLTYRAVLHLCRGGYTEQADLLNRSLFEDMTYALWVSLPEHQEEAVELLEQHHQYGLILARDSIEQNREWLGVEPGELRDGLDWQREQLAETFGRHGERTWTGRELHAILAEIDQLWPHEEQAKRGLWGFYSLGHRINNQKLHTASLAIGRVAAKSPAGKKRSLVARPLASPAADERSMLRALYGAMFTYYWIARQVIVETGGDAGAFEAYYGRQLDLLEKLAPSQRSALRRNDACPCGSGKKLKRCHGR